jgi:hypothetical protein
MDSRSRYSSWYAPPSLSHGCLAKVDYSHCNTIPKDSCNDFEHCADKDNAFVQDLVWALFPLFVIQCLVLANSLSIHKSEQ